MKPSITIDATAWKQAARALQETSSRSVVDFLNGQMLRLLSWTIYATKKASVQKIESLMMERANGAKPGTGLRGSFAERLLVSYKSKHGTWPVRGESHEARIARLIALKRQSSAMLRAGWLKAMNTFRKIVKGQPPGVADIKRFGLENQKLGGWAKPARLTIGVITAEAANEALGYVGREKAWTGTPNPAGAVAVASKGLQSAMNRQTKDMIDTLAKRLKKDLKPFGAK